MARSYNYLVSDFCLPTRERVTTPENYLIKPTRIKEQYSNKSKVGEGSLIIADSA